MRCHRLLGFQPRTLAISENHEAEVQLVMVKENIIGGDPEPDTRRTDFNFDLDPRQFVLRRCHQIHPLNFSEVSFKMAKKRILRGYELCDNGKVRADYFDEARFSRAFSPPPVVWNGETASLYYWNYSRTSTPINQNASGLIIDTGITIHGPAFVVTGSERWHHFRAEGSFDEVQDKLAHVRDDPTGKIVVLPSPPWDAYQDVYVEDDNEAFHVKLVL